MNKVYLEGYLIRDVILKYGDNNKTSTFNTLSVSEKPDDNPTFIPIIAFGEVANRIHYWAKKGSRIAISGRLDVRNEKISDGNWKQSAIVVVRSVSYMENKLEMEIKKPKQELGKQEISTPKNDQPFEDDPFTF